jgi:dolichol-phosphate mannosyltransferase
MDRKVVSIINALPEKDRFLRGLRAWVGFPQKAVLFKRHKRFAGVSTQSYRSYVSWAIFAITSFSTVPLRAVTLFACFMTLLTMLFLGFFLALYAFNVRGPEGFLSTIAIVLMVGSGMFICQAILAEYILRIYKEVKNRSEFILESAMNNPGSLAQANEPDPKATN